MFECSSYKVINLKEVFEPSIKTALNPPAKKTTDVQSSSSTDGCCKII
jgi:hypothetical protein